MSSGPCQKPAALNAWRSSATLKSRLALRNHAQRDDAPLFLVRPGEHQLRAAHRLFVEDAHLGDVIVLADVGLVARTPLGLSRDSAVVRDVDGNVVGNRNAERTSRP